MKSENEILHYYDDIAPVYDTDRFGNSYGEYIHSQERAILERRMPGRDALDVLDLGCGTGRLLEYADCGVDLSPRMIEMAAGKHPATPLFVEDAAHTHFDAAGFDRIISFHLLMHLDRDKTRAILDEAHRLLRPGGRFIFDFPSKRRRRLLGKRQAGWHGANDFSLGEIKALTADNWRLEFVGGVLFLPIHRIPRGIRPLLVTLDNALCRSPLKALASYLVVEVEKCG